MQFISKGGVRNHLACTEFTGGWLCFALRWARPRTGENAGEAGVAWGPVARGRQRPGVRGGEAQQRGGRTGGVKQKQKQRVEGGGGMSRGGHGKGGEEIRPSEFTVLPFPSLYLYHLCDSPNLTLLV